MTLYHFVIGRGSTALELSFKGRSAVDALHKLISFLNGAVIQKAYCGDKQRRKEGQESGYTDFPELAKRLVFSQPKPAGCLSGEPILISEDMDEADAPISATVVSKP